VTEQGPSVVNRRTALQTISSGTATLAGIGSAVNVVGADGPTQKIVVLAEGDRSAESRSVSQQWYRHVETARRVNERLKSKYLDQSDVVRVGIGLGDTRIGGLRSHEIVVGIDSEANSQKDDATPTTVPEEVEGIPVRTEEASRTVPTCGEPKDDCYMGSYVSYGGLAVESYMNGGDDGFYGTSCCRVILNGTKYLMTARHLFTESENKCADDFGSDPQLYLDGGSFVGKPEHYYKDSDVALVNPSGTDITNEVSDEPGKGVVGRVTGDGLSYLSSTGDIIEKRGRCSCRTDGRIKEFGTSESCGLLSSIDGIVTSSLTQKKRDSGGIVYFEPDTSTEDLYMVNLAMGHPHNDTSRTIGTSGDYMYKNHDIWFGGDPYNGN
jgi:hypothetical protein